MKQATFHFHRDLAFFLPHRHRQHPWRHTFNEEASIKDMVESLGVPHPEIAALMVNGQAVDFSYLVQAEDEITVYGVTGMTSTLPLRPELPAERRFVLDVHLGKLANRLRLLGFDTAYRNHCDDEELAYISHHEGRILLTRDVGLLKRSLVIHGYYLRSTKPEKQLEEVIQRFDLVRYFKPFHRCSKCNHILQAVAKADITGQVSAQTLEYYDQFYQCSGCQQIYWRGSHFEQLEKWLETLRKMQVTPP